jgi:ribosome modulation factor
VNIHDLHLLYRDPHPAALDALKDEGYAAKRLGLPRESCPPFRHEGMRAAWLDGWDAAPEPESLVKRFESGGPLLYQGDL